MSKEDIKGFISKEYRIDKERRDEKIGQLEKNTPGQMLKYPNFDPSVNEMLVKYTIWKDLKVYSCFFDRLEKNAELFEDMRDGLDKIPRSEVTNHSMNVYVSIAIEAERRFKKIYVNTDDIRK